MFLRIAMFINDELKVVWKTKCRWRDQGHLAKRKDLKPKGVNAEVDFAMLPLKPGDDVRIRFGKQWYDGDMVEEWNPETEVKDKAKKGIFPS